MRSVKGNKELLLKKVTKPASLTASRFCGVCVAATALQFSPTAKTRFARRFLSVTADFDFAVGVGYGFALCAVGDFALSAFEDLRNWD